jgi:hypothetical protein
LLQIAKSYPPEHEGEARRLILGTALLSDQDFTAWAGTLLEVCRVQSMTSVSPLGKISS